MAFKIHRPTKTKRRRVALVESEAEKGNQAVEGNHASILDFGVDGQENKVIDESVESQKDVPVEAQKFRTNDRDSSQMAPLDAFLNEKDSMPVGMTSVVEEDEPVQVPRSQPRKKSRKLEKIEVDHAVFPFQKVFYEPIAGESASNVPATGVSTVDQSSLLDPAAASIAPISDWSEAGLPLPLMKVIEQRGFGLPTPVQAQCLPLAMSGLDLVGLAPTGSGKTVAFLLPLVRHVAGNGSAYAESASVGPFAVVLVPTRELCLQIAAELEPWARAMGLRALSCYGGQDIGIQISKLVGTKPHVLVATPGRLIDLLAANGGRVLNLGSVTFFVVDETDRMFDLGFGPQVRKIVETVRPDRQTVVFSATMQPAMAVLVTSILNDAVKVEVGESKVAENIEQRAELVTKDDKLERLVALLEEHHRQDSSSTNSGSAIVFVNTQVLADTLHLNLKNHGVLSHALHGGMDQRDRENVITDFRDGRFPVLLATSVAARGLDVKHLNLVVNYDAASHFEDHVHRAGRTGRAGQSGTCVTFIEPNQTREAFELGQSMELPTAELQKLAEKYANSKEAKLRQRAGFGGHGLAKLESKWNLQRTVELGAYAESSDAMEMAKPEVTKRGSTWVARLVVNDAPKEARIAVTAVGKQNEVSSEFNVSLTLKGTYLPDPRPNTQPDAKLHLRIEGSSEEDVVGAYQELWSVLAAKSMDVESSGKYSSF